MVVVTPLMEMIEFAAATVICALVTGQRAVAKNIGICRPTSLAEAETLRSCG